MATRWAYGAEIAKLGLSMSELAVLRAICFAADPKTNLTGRIFDRDLMRLTGYKGHQPIIDARRRLRKLNLLAFKPATGDSAAATPSSSPTDAGSSVHPYGFIYYVRAKPPDSDRYY